MSYKNIIASALVSQKENLLPDLEKAILDPTILPENRRLLIALWQESKLPPSDNLLNSLDFNLKSDLVRVWPELSNNSFISEIIGNFKTAKNDLERLTALELFLDKNNSLIINTLWQIIFGDYSDAVKKKAFFILANLDNKAEIYQEAEVLKLRSLLESADFPHRLKDQAILALGDYYPLFPGATESLLVDVVNRPQYFDDYQRSFAVDILNNNRELQVSGFELSPAAWDAYFNN